jgi:outer membrane protein assembly factor BamB
MTLEGAVMVLEQETGRLRWLRRLPPSDPHGTTGVLAAEGRLYVVRQRTKESGFLYCLDLTDGRPVWTAPVGSTNWYARAAPILADGVVSFGHLKGNPGSSVIQGWDAATGKSLWEVKLEVAQYEAHGCAIDGRLVYSGGSRKDREGETLAIEPKTGTVLWRTTDVHCGYRGTPSARDGRVYLTGWDLPPACVSATDGSVVWKSERRFTWGHAPALGPDFFTGRGYSGHAEAWRLEDGKPKMAGKKQVLLGGPDHACGPVVLTSGGFSLATTVSGLYVRDVSTGEILWRSPGFAPRSCSNPIAASGRVFYNPQVNGMLYCFEPEK